MAAKMIKLPGAPTPAQPSAVAQDDDTVLITGHEVETDKLVKYKFDMDSGKKGLEAVRKLLEPIAKMTRLEAEKAGRFAARILFQGTQQRASFAFTNSFGAIDASQKPLLAGAIGPTFDTLFVEQEAMRVRPEKLAELHAAIKATNMNPDDFFVTEKVLRPVEEFRRKRFEIRPALTEAQNDALDATMDQIASSPTLTTK